LEFGLISAGELKGKRDPSMRSRRHPPALQFCTWTFFFCYALSTAGTLTASGQESSNLLKFDHT